MNTYFFSRNTTKQSKSLNRFVLTTPLCVIILLICVISMLSVAKAQNIGINSTGAAGNASAILDIDASPGNNKGLLIPRLTTAQMNAIATPATGLIIYNTDCNSINYYNGVTWIALGNTGSVATPGAITGSATPCQNATGVAYSIAAVSGATGYNWTVPAGATVATGQGTTSITANFGTTNGNVCVTAYNACGSSNASCIAITLSTTPAAPTANAASSITQTSFSANWNSVGGATTYFLDVDDNSDFSTPLGGYNNLNAGAVTTYSVTGLTCNTAYYYRVRAGNGCGASASSNTITVTTSACCTPGSQTFSYTGGVQTLTITSSIAACSPIHIKSWGAGGGGGGNSNAGNGGGAGGGGGYAYSDLAVNAGDVITIICAGGGGLGPSSSCNNKPGGSPGWGNSTYNGGTGGIGGPWDCDPYPNGNGGGGGGGTAVYNGLGFLLVAGGGGSGGGAGQVGGGGGCSGGGAGQNGNTCAGCSGGSAGGSGSGQGGDGGTGNSGGGGAGGGGANGGTGTAHGQGGCGGGGGNNSVTGGFNVVTANGSGATPGNSGDPDRPGGVGNGGGTGGNGFVKITW